MVETLIPTDFQQDRALRADKVSRDFLVLDRMMRVALRPSILVPYESIDEGTKDFEVTPRVLFGMYLIQRSLINDLLVDIEKAA